MKSILISLSLFLISFSGYSQPLILESDKTENISFLINFLDKKPEGENLKTVQYSLKSNDTLEYMLAISILFKYYPTDENKRLIIEAFMIPYEDSRRATIKKIYTGDEVKKMWVKINNEFEKKYTLTQEEIYKINFLHSFIVYRKYKVWIYKNEHIATPSNVLNRGIYLRFLLNDTMDYKGLISDMIEHAKLKHEEMINSKEGK